MFLLIAGAGVSTPAAPPAASPFQSSAVSWLSFCASHPGLECMFLLMALKVKFPDQIWMLRGNHEHNAINRIYGFYDECRRCDTLCPMMPAL